MSSESSKIITGVYKSLSDLIKFALIWMGVVLHLLQPKFFWLDELKFFIQIVTDAVVPCMYTNPILSGSVLKLYLIGGAYFSDPNLRLTHVPGLICNHVSDWILFPFSLPHFISVL